MTAELPSIGTIYLKFGDLGEAEAVFGAVKARCPLWNIRYISPVQVASKIRPENPKASYITIFEGQLLVVAKYDNVHGPLDVGALAGHVHQFLGNFGGLVSFRIIKKDDKASTYRAEYFNISAVYDVMNVNGFKICVSSGTPSGTCSELTHTGVHLDHITLRAGCDQCNREGSWPPYYRSRVWSEQCVGEYEPQHPPRHVRPSDPAHPFLLAFPHLDPHQPATSPTQQCQWTTRTISA